MTDRLRCSQYQASAAHRSSRSRRRRRLDVDAHDGGAATALCTTECSSDDDCAAMAGAYCRDGYGCKWVSGYPRRVCACR